MSELSEFERWAKKHVLPGFREHYGHLDTEETIKLFGELGFFSPEEVARLLVAWRKGELALPK